MKSKLVLGLLVVLLAGFALSRLGNHKAEPSSYDLPPSGSTEEASPSASGGVVPPRSTFDDDPCTSDCSGHEAGYNWAEEHSITDEDDCDQAGETSNSPSFASGCKAYVRGDDPDEVTDDDDPDSQ